MEDVDRRALLEMLREAFSRAGVGLFTYVLMRNHFHLLACVSGTRIAIPMHRALTRYSLYFNKKYRRAGHLFQDRFKAKLCRHSAYFVNLVVYINANPVRAGIVKEVSQWRWSGHAELLAGSGRYLQLDRMDATMGMTVDELRSLYRDRLTPQAYTASLPELVRQAAYLAGVDADGLYDGRQGGDYTQAKRILITWALDEGYSILDLARELKCTPSSLSQLRMRHPF